MRSPLGSLFQPKNLPPVPYVGRRSGGFGSLGALRGNPQAQMSAMGTVGTLFAIVDLTSTATSQVEWRLWRKRKPGQDKENEQDRVEVFKHAALDVWQKPNPFMPRQELIQASQQHIDLVGESYWLVTRAKGLNVPLELWPVRPDRMAPVPHPTEYLSGWTYKTPDGEDIPLGLDQVIQLRMPNPLDPYRGMGPVQALLADLDSSRYTSEWNRNFFLNSAEPGGIVEIDRRLSDDEFEEMQARWNEQHRGVDKAHRVALLENGKWVSRAFTQRDMQFAELRQVTRNTIMEAFRIHQHMMGIAHNVNRANAEAAAYDFARWLIVPRLERIKAALNNVFLPMFGRTGEGVEFDYDSPIDEDETAKNHQRDSKVKAVVDLVTAGFKADEVLKAYDMPALSYGPATDSAEHDLLVKIVVGAPTLAPLILPMLGYTIPEAALNSYKTVSGGSSGDQSGNQQGGNANGAPASDVNTQPNAP